MKKTILFATALFALGTMMAQTFVSTTPSNKKVILEEYTGVNCGYCPDGHKRANELVAANPGNAWAINIHQGGYAVRYTTQWGNALAGQTGLDGYPSGTVNRHVFSGSAMALGRGNWAAAANQILAQSSPVNVAARGTLDFATRQLTLEVEAYYTGNSNTPINMLNVAVLQDNIIGPQSGAAANPDYVVGSQYRHMHMLRDLVTGQWGDTISTTTEGTFVTRTYTYDVPMTISNEEMVLEDLSIIVFIAEGRAEILTGCEAQLSYANAQPKLSDLKATIVPNCEMEFGATAYLKNMSEGAITSAELTYGVAGNNSTYTWTGNIAPGAIEEIALPTIDGNFTSGTNYTLEVTLSGINGTAFNGNSRTVTLNKEVYYTPMDSLYFVLATDRFASETTFKIMSTDGTIILQGGPWTDGSSNNTTLREYAFLPPAEGCYILEVYDKYSDGINGGYGSGYFTLSNSQGRLFRNNGKFGAMAQYFFSVGDVAIDETEEAHFTIYPNPTHGQLNINSNQTIRQVKVYDINGRETMTVNGNVKSLNTESLNGGIYTIRIESENGTRIQKFVKL